MLIEAFLILNYQLAELAHAGAGSNPGYYYVIIILPTAPLLQGLGVVGPLLVEPIKMRSAPWKVAKSRIELLESLNQDPGLEAGGLTVKKVMEVLSLCSLSLPLLVISLALFFFA